MKNKSVWLFLKGTNLGYSYPWNSHVFYGNVRFQSDRISYSLINTFFLGYLSSALNMLSLLPVFLCLYVSVQKALVSGGLWEAQLSVLNSFIRSPAVSCQGFSFWLVSEGRTGSVQHVGTRSQLLDWCSWSPWSLKVEEKFDLIMAVVSVHLFVLFVLRGLQCAIKRCRSKLNMQP